MNRPVEVLKYQGLYALKMKRVFLGNDTNRENEEAYENRVFMYLGTIRLDITDYNAAQVQLIVKKLQIMGLAKV